MKVLLTVPCVCGDDCGRSLKVLENEPRKALYDNGEEVVLAYLEDVYVDLGNGHPPVVDIDSSDGHTRMLVISYADARALVALGAVKIADGDWRLT